MKETILDAAERRARHGGYHGFSFRELAEDVGIKSASVHYHFPTKEILASALAERYVNRTMAHLGDPHDYTAMGAVQRLADLFIAANETDHQMCLCGIFAAEGGALPDSVIPHVAAFFDRIIEWLETALGLPDAARDHDPHDQGPRPMEILSSLEGALLISRLKRDPAILRTAVSALLDRMSPA